MSWLRGEIPEELKGLNLTPAEIAAAVKAKGELELRIKKTDEELATAKASLQTTNASLEELGTKAKELEARINAGNGDDLNRRVDPNKPISFLDDENAAFNQRVMPVALMAANAAAMTAKMSARQSLSGRFIETVNGRLSLEKLWDRWGAEIDKHGENVPIANRGNPLTWINIFNYLQGVHMGEIMAKPSDFVEPVATNTNVRVGNEPLPEKLTEEELRIASKMRITPEKYLERKKKMNFATV